VNGIAGEDVPSPIDLRLMADAVEWERTAMETRPWRADFFARFASEIAQEEPPARRILELGSGPGFLADHLLRALPGVSYVLLDFSPAMHELARARLAAHADRCEFVERSFKEPRWAESLGMFECIVTNQAVHELRHKRYAIDLHASARSVLAPGGVYLVCDHFVGQGGMTNDQLYMTAEEQAAALVAAGFVSVRRLMMKGGMVLHRAS
jgi:SAM-dependent methyltransferase